MHQEENRTIRLILDDDEAWRQLANEFPDDIGEIDRPQELPRLASELESLALALGSLIANKSEADSNTIDTVVNEDSQESNDDIDKILHSIISISDAEAEAKRHVILLAHKNIELFEKAVHESKNKRQKKCNILIKSTERAISRSWDISELLANQELLVCLYDTFSNYQSDNANYQTISEDLTRLLTKQLKNHFFVNGTLVSEEDMQGLFKIGEHSIKAGSKNQDYYNVFIESLIASINSAKKADPELVLDHYANILLAISRIPSKENQKELIISLCQIINKENSLYKAKLLMAKALTVSQSNLFAIVTIENELSASIDYKMKIITDSTKFIEDATTYYLSHTKDQDSMDFIITVKDFISKKPQFKEIQAIKKQFMDEITPLYKKYMDSIDKLLSETIISLADCEEKTDILKGLIDNDKSNTRAMIEEPFKQIVDKYSAMYPDLAKFFESCIDSEQSELMLKYRSYVAGRADLGTAIGMAKDTKDEILSYSFFMELLPEDISKLLEEFPEEFRLGYIISIIPMQEGIKTFTVDEIPLSIFDEVKEKIKNRPINTSPRTTVSYNNHILIFRPSTENDNKRIAPVDLLYSLEDRVLPTEEVLSKLELSNVLENIRQKILQDTRIFVGLNGFITKFNINNKPVTVTIKRHQEKSPTLAGTLLYGSIRAPFVFDNSRILHFDDNKNDSQLRLQLSILLSNILYEFTCRPAIESDNGLTTESEKLFLKRVAYLSYLPIGKNFSKKQSDLFLEIEGRDLATASNSRKLIDSQSRNSTYVTAVEYEKTASPIKLVFNPNSIKLLA